MRAVAPVVRAPVAPVTLSSVRRFPFIHRSKLFASSMQRSLSPISLATSPVARMAIALADMHEGGRTVAVAPTDIRAERDASMCVTLNC